MGDRAGDRLAGQVGAQLLGTAGQRGAQSAEGDVGVAVRRLRAAGVVAGRPGGGARGLGTVAQRPRLVEPGERAAAGADRQDLNAREDDRVAVLDRPLLGDAQLAVVDETDVGARPAHVEPDGVGVAGLDGEVSRRDGTGGDARGREPDREAVDHPRRHRSATGVQEEQVTVVAVGGEFVAQPVDVSGDQRREHGVGSGRVEAFVLEDLGQDLGRRAQVHPRQLLGEDLAHPSLVSRVGVGVDEAHGDGLDLALLEEPGDLAGLDLVERLDDLARIVDPLGDLEAVAAADVGAADVLVGVPQVVLRAVTDLQDVAESARRHHRGLGETPGDEGVRGDGRAVGEEGDGRQIDLAALHTVDDGPHRVVGSGRHLGDADVPGVFVDDADVGEGAADVDGDAQ